MSCEGDECRATSSACLVSDLITLSLVRGSVRLVLGADKNCIEQ